MKFSVKKALAMENGSVRKKKRKKRGENWILDRKNKVGVLKTHKSKKKNGNWLKGQPVLGRAFTELGLPRPEAQPMDLLSHFGPL